MFTFLSIICKPYKHPFNKNYRNGYKKLWINSLRCDHP